MTRVTLKKLSKVYKEACEKEDYKLADSISFAFWQLKKVRKAFEKYIGPKDKPHVINHNSHDTPDYYSMKPSEQANVEFRFMDEVLFGKRKI